MVSCLHYSIHNGNVATHGGNIHGVQNGRRNVQGNCPGGMSVGECPEGCTFPVVDVK